MADEFENFNHNCKQLLQTEALTKPKHNEIQKKAFYQCPFEEITIIVFVADPTNKFDMYGHVVHWLNIEINIA